MSRKIKPAENKLPLRDALHNAYHTSFEHVRKPKGAIVLRFQPRVFLHNLWLIACRVLGVRAKETFALSGEARRRIAETEGKPSVLHVICNMEIGGSQKIILDMFEHMSDLYRMKILTGHIPFYAKYSHIPIAVLNTREEILEFLRAERPEIVHVHFWGLEDWLQMFLDAAFELKTEIGYRIIENSNNPIKAFYDERIDHIAHVSRFVLDLQGGDIPLWKQSVVYPGVDEEDFRLKVGRDDPRSVGMVYRLTNDKISAETIELLIRIARAVPDVLIHVVGDGPNLRHFIERATEAGVRRNIVFKGFVPYEMLSSLYERFNVFLAPVHHESYGVVMPYALLKGNPMVAYDVDAVREILGGENPVVDNEDAFVRYVVACTTGAEETGGLVRRNRVRAEGMFTLRKMIEGYDALYRDQLARPAAKAERRGRALVHVRLGKAPLPYYAGLFGYRGTGNDPQALRAEIDGFKSRAGAARMAVELDFTGRQDEDSDALVEALRGMRYGVDSLVTIAFDSPSGVRLCYLYRAGAGGGLFPAEAEGDNAYEISVCMPTYNRKDILLKALRALDEDYRLSPELAGKVELRIVDDSSTDGTPEAIDAIMGGLSLPVAVKRIPNSGPARARNEAARAARGRVVLFIDDDKIVERGFLMRHYEFHQRNPGPGAAGLGYVDWPPYLEKTFLMDHVMCEFGGEQFGYCIIDQLDQEDLPYEFFVTANISVKRELLDVFGGFHEEVFRDAMWEDTELGWRLKGMAGMRIHYLPEAVLYHDHRLTLTDFVRRQFKVGQYVGKLNEFPFMRPRRGERRDILAHFTVVRTVLGAMGIGDLICLAARIEKNEGDLLSRYGKMRMHLLYKNVLLAAYVMGMKDPEPLRPAECAASAAACLDALADLVSLTETTRQTALYYDDGTGALSEDRCIRQPALPFYRKFSLRFDLAGAGRFKHLRWDPLPLSPCRVRIDNVRYTSEAGSHVEVPLSGVTYNGFPCNDRYMEFFSLDPQVSFPELPGRGGSILIEGEWELISPMAFREFLGKAGAKQAAEPEAAYPEVAYLYYDTGGGFTQSQVITARVQPLSGYFDFRYDLPGDAGFNSLRWDPVSDHRCRVRLDGIEYAPTSGAREILNPRAVGHNGRDAGKGWIEFMGPDPWIILPAIKGRGGKVYLRGEIEIIGPCSASSPAQGGRMARILGGLMRRASCSRVLGVLKRHELSYRILRGIKRRVSSLLGLQ